MFRLVVKKKNLGYFHLGGKVYGVSEGRMAPFYFFYRLLHCVLGVQRRRVRPKENFFDFVCVFLVQVQFHVRRVDKFLSVLDNRVCVRVAGVAHLAAVYPRSANVEFFAGLNDNKVDPIFYRLKVDGKKRSLHLFRKTFLHIGKRRVNVYFCLLVKKRIKERKSLYVVPVQVRKQN